MDILKESESENEEPVKLFEIDENRLNELIQLAQQHYPDIPEYFVHTVAVEHCMLEQVYEPDEELANELYRKAQEELKTTEYNIKVEKNLSD
jgi:hypothetical protein